MDALHPSVLGKILATDTTNVALDAVCRRWRAVLAAERRRYLHGTHRTTIYHFLRYVTHIAPIAIEHVSEDDYMFSQQLRIGSELVAVPRSFRVRLFPFLLFFVALFDDDGNLWASPDVPMRVVFDRYRKTVAFAVEDAAGGRKLRYQLPILGFDD